MKGKTTCLITLGGGGHTKQILNLIEMMGDKFTYEYVVNDDDHVSIKKIKYPGKVFVIRRPRGVHEDSKIKNILRFIQSILEAFNVVRKSKAQVVISAGPGIAFPLFVWAILFGKKRIFLESWSRVKTKSTAGKLCYPISNLFFIQWPDQQENYPKGIFAGRLG